MTDFRRLTPAEAGEALTLQRAAFLSEAEAYGTFEIPALRDTTASLVHEIATNILVGAFDGARLVASVRLTVDDRVGWISRVAVAPDRQGGGIGSALVGFAERVAPSEVEEFRLAVAGNSGSNIRLYRRLGYTEHERRPDAAGTEMMIMGKSRTPRILLITGSNRKRSVNTAVLQTLAGLAGPRLAADLYTALGSLPHFDPDVIDTDLDPAVTGLRTAVGAARILVFSTPEYAGALPGSFKNLLDWLVGAPEMSGKAAAWVNASAAMNGASAAYASLANVLRYVDTTVVGDACRSIPLGHGSVDIEGRIPDPAVRSELTGVVDALCRFVVA